MPARRGMDPRERQVLIGRIAREHGTAVGLLDASEEVYREVGEAIRAERTRLCEEEGILVQGSIRSGRIMGMAGVIGEAKRTIEWWMEQNLRRDVEATGWKTHWLVGTAAITTSVAERVKMEGHGLREWKHRGPFKAERGRKEEQGYCCPVAATEWVLNRIIVKEEDRVFQDPNWPAIELFLTNYWACEFENEYTEQAGIEWARMLEERE